MLFTTKNYLTHLKLLMSVQYAPDAPESATTVADSAEQQETPEKMSTREALKGLREMLSDKSLSADDLAEIEENMDLYKEEVKLGLLDLIKSSLVTGIKGEDMYDKVTSLLYTHDKSMQFPGYYEFEGALNLIFKIKNFDGELSFRSMENGNIQVTTNKELTFPRKDGGTTNVLGTIDTATGEFQANLDSDIAMVAATDSIESTIFDFGRFDKLNALIDGALESQLTGDLQDADAKLTEAEKENERLKAELAEAREARAMLQKKSETDKILAIENYEHERVLAETRDMMKLKERKDNEVTLASGQTLNGIIETKYGKGVDTEVVVEMLKKEPYNADIVTKLSNPKSLKAGVTIYMPPKAEVELAIETAKYDSVLAEAREMMKRKSVEEAKTASEKLAKEEKITARAEGVYSRYSAKKLAETREALGLAPDAPVKEIITTAIAVQEANSLKVDGIVGPQTLAALEKPDDDWKKTRFASL